MSGAGERTWVVDRIEGETVVLVEDGTSRTAEVGRSGIGVTVREGTVLRVPASDSGTLLWAAAATDDEAERERRREGERIVDELRRRDPGGDVTL